MCVCCAFISISACVCVCKHSCVCVLISMSYIHITVVSRGRNFRKFVNFLAQLKQGEVEGLKVRVDRLQSLIRTSCIERLECGHWDQIDKHLQQRIM